MDKIKRPKSAQPIPKHAKCVFKGVMFDVYQWEQEMYDGTKKTFEKLKRPDSVAVFPILPNGKILLTRQSQPGRDEFTDVPSGRIDDGEDPLEAGLRELKEETGYTSNDVILWKAEQATAKIDWAVYIFIAKNCQKVALQNVDHGEKIEVFEATFDELLDLSQRPDFRAKEVVVDFLHAYYNNNKKEELKKLFGI